MASQAGMLGITGGPQPPCPSFNAPPCRDQGVARQAALVDVVCCAVRAVVAARAVVLLGATMLACSAACSMATTCLHTAGLICALASSAVQRTPTCSKA